MRPLIYAKWARTGHRDLAADEFFDVLRAIKNLGSDPDDTTRALH
jgi:hypothetical protein